MVNPGLPGTRLRVGPSSMGITLPITIGLPMGVTWPVTPPMPSIHVERGEGRRRASPNKSVDSGFSDSGDSEESPFPTRGHQGGNHVSRVYLSGKEEEHNLSPSSLPIIKVANQTTSDRKKRGGKGRGGDELSRGSKGSPVVPTETKSCDEEVGSKLLLLQEYESGPASFSCLGGGNTLGAGDGNTLVGGKTQADAKNASSLSSSPLTPPPSSPPPPPPPPNQRPPSISRSASISLSSPAFSNLSQTSFQNFSETSSRNGDLSSGSSPTQAPPR